MNKSGIDKAYQNNRVGPVFRAGEVAVAAVDAAREDNPDREIYIDDQVAYVRIEADGELILKRESLERALGRAFEMTELEVSLSSFAGRIESSSEYVRFYFSKSI